MKQATERVNKVLSNGEFFFKYCYKNDLCRINRMWLKYLDKTIGRDAPLWEKQALYDRWMGLTFDVREWDIAKGNNWSFDSTDIVKPAPKKQEKLKFEW